MYRHSTRLLRASLLASVCLAVPAAASATPFTISTIVKDTQSLAANETGTVTSAGDLRVTSSTPDVTFTGTNVELDNAGTIEQLKTGKRAILDDAVINHSFTINNGNSTSTITAGGDAIHISNDLGSGTATLTNYGTISSTGTGGDNGQAIDFDNNTSGSATITNESTGVISAADADAIRPGANATINNYGHITGSTIGDSGNDGIDYKANSGTLNNLTGGTISGARHGITGDNNLTVINSGTITGNDGSSINLDTTSGTTSVTNHGTITGTAVTGDGDGIDVDNLLSLDNYGTVNAVGSVSGEINEGLAIGGGTIHNHTGGTIMSDQRAITVDNSNLGNAFGQTSITNDAGATIDGKDGEAIKITSTFADTLDNAGTIMGSVQMGAGSDALTLHNGQTITGAVSAAGGSNTIDLVAGATGQTSGTLALAGGTWNVHGDGAYQGDLRLTAGQANLSGEINGSVTVDGGVLDPMVTIDGDLTIDSGVLLIHEGDLIDVGQNLTVGPGATIALVLTSFDGLLGTDPMSGAPTLDLSQFLTATHVNLFAPGAIGITTYDGRYVGQSIAVTYDGTFVGDATVAAPEPATAALFLAGLGVLAAGRRRRRRPIRAAN